MQLLDFSTSSQACRCLGAEPSGTKTVKLDVKFPSYLSEEQLAQHKALWHRPAPAAAAAALGGKGTSWGWVKTRRVRATEREIQTQTLQGSSSSLEEKLLINPATKHLPPLRSFPNLVEHDASTHHHWSLCCKIPTETLSETIFSEAKWQNEVTIACSASNAYPGRSAHGSRTHMKREYQLLFAPTISTAFEEATLCISCPLYI